MQKWHPWSKTGKILLQSREMDDNNASDIVFLVKIGSKSLRVSPYKKLLRLSCKQDITPCRSLTSFLDTRTSSIVEIFTRPASIELAISICTIIRTSWVEKQQLFLPKSAAMQSVSTRGQPSFEIAKRSLSVTSLAYNSSSTLIPQASKSQSASLWLCIWCLGTSIIGTAFHGSSPTLRTLFCRNQA